MDTRFRSRLQSRFRSSASAIVVGMVVSTAPTAQGQTVADSDRSVGLDRFRLSTDRDGLLDVEWGATPRAGSWNASLFGSYADDPLVVRDADTDERLGSPVHGRLGAAAGFAFSLTDRLQVGAVVPMTLWQGGDQTIPGVAALPARSLGGAGLGNLRVIPKLGLLRSNDGTMGLAVLAHIVLPAIQTNGYFGDRQFGLEPEVAASAAWGAIRLAANLGYRWRTGNPTLLAASVHDELVARAGFGYRFGNNNGVPGPFELDFTIYGATAANAPFDKALQNAGAMAAALQYDLPAPVTVFAGGGVGLAPAYGIPDMHAFAGVRMTAGALPSAPPPAPVMEDDDGDGVRGAADQCPREAEDGDGFEDSDGCPEPDNDKDGVLDAADKCPNDTGVVENNGCPDGDSDNDGIVDRLDRCPQEVEDRDSFEDTDGCPDPDNDHDGIADGDDACPTEAGVADLKGCPDKDRDGDGVVDRRDNCPDEAGDPANSGCKAKQLARITDSGIEISDTVYFKVDQGVIQKKSFPLLENVAQVLKNHPEVGLMRIEGHTDARGDDGHNQLLSEKRAQAVLEFLVQRGIARERLTARGFGETQPIGDNKTAAGRAKNRRVVFTKETPSKPAAP